MKWLQRTEKLWLGNRTICLLVIALLLAGVTVQADDAPAANTNKWTGDISFGLTVTGGNSDTSLGTLGFTADKKWKKNELHFEGSGAYGKSDGDITADNARISGQYNRFFEEKLYGSFRIDAMHDDVAEVSYRLIFSPAVGYYFVKNDKTKFNGEMGPAFITERIEMQKAPGVFRRGEQSYFTMRFTERLEQKVSDTAKFWEQLDYLPQVDDFTEKFLINFETGLEVSINTHLALRTTFRWNYNNDPPPNRRSYDIASITSIVYKY